MNVFITGVTGYLGQRLAASLVKQGHRAVGSSRREYELGQPVDPAMFEGCDVVIHAAHDFKRGAMDRNIEGTRACFAAARKCGVRRQIFLSSYSARADALSEYGKTKYRIERIFLEGGETVLRPGLVVGNGGLFARQRAALLRTPVVPVIGDGSLPTVVIAIGHFLDATAAAMIRGEPGEFGLFYDERPSMRQFVRAIKAHAGQCAVILPLPVSVAKVLVRLGRALGLNVPADPDQIEALRLGATPQGKSDLPSLLPGRDAEFCLEYALRELAANGRE
jgi:nucleoside-diphosphate-sugar epimerase